MSYYNAGALAVSNQGPFQRTIPEVNTVTVALQLIHIHLKGYSIGEHCHISMRDAL